MKTIGIVGSRSRTGSPVVKLIEDTFLKIYEDGDQLVSGGCPVGADRVAELLAQKHEIPITIHYARWKKHGNSAGPIRNFDIAADADVLIATVSQDRTGGTEDTIKKFLKNYSITEEQAIALGKLILL